MNAHPPEQYSNEEIREFQKAELIVNERKPRTGKLHRMKDPIGGSLWYWH